MTTSGMRITGFGVITTGICILFKQIPLPTLTHRLFLTIFKSTSLAGFINKPPLAGSPKYQLITSVELISKLC